MKADPDAALRPRSIVEAGRLAFQPAMELLHSKGADLNAVWRGYRPLHSLLQEEPHRASGTPSAERLECLDWLLAHGADPEQPGAWPPARAIIIAAFMGEPRYVNRLRKARARIDGFAAAALGDQNLVQKTLIRSPGFVRQRDSGGLTALQCAAGSRFSEAAALDVAMVLLRAGADLRMQTKSWNHNIDAVYLAASAKNKALFALLLEHGADATEALVPAVWNADEEFAELALQRGAQPDLAVADSQPLLNSLIRWGQIRKARWLLAHGASPNVPDHQGWTALHQAASRGNEQMMRALLEAGGDAARRDHQGSTPIDIARRARRNKLVDLLRR